MEVKAVEEEIEFSCEPNPPSMGDEPVDTSIDEGKSHVDEL